MIAGTSPLSAKTDWEPTSSQAADLEESRRQTEDWENARIQFLERDLKLTEAEIASITSLRDAAAVKEDSLMTGAASPSDPEPLRERLVRNRAQYDTELQGMLGKDRWRSYLAFYGEQWKASVPQSTLLHLPLK